MQEEHLRGRTGSRMGQRRAGSPKPFCSLIGVPNKSSHLFGFDDKQVQFNFTSDLGSSTFSSCRKQRKLDQLGSSLGREASSPKTRGTLCLSTNRQACQVMLAASRGLVLGGRGLGACRGGPGPAWGQVTGKRESGAAAKEEGRCRGTPRAAWRMAPVRRGGWRASPGSPEVQPSALRPGRCGPVHPPPNTASRAALIIHLSTAACRECSGSLSHGARKSLGCY